MTNEEVAVRLEHFSQEIKSLKHRMDNGEKKDESLIILSGSVKELAVNMNHMADELSKQGERLKSLENAPLDNYNYYKRTIISCLLTGVLGAVIGSILTFILN